jgi:hypothetical protein
VSRLLTGFGPPTGCSPHVHIRTGHVCEGWVPWDPWVLGGVLQTIVQHVRPPKVHVLQVPCRLGSCVSPRPRQNEKLQHAQNTSEMIL